MWGRARNNRRKSISVARKSGNRDLKAHFFVEDPSTWSPLRFSTPLEDTLCGAINMMVEYEILLLFVNFKLIVPAEVFQDLVAAE